MHNGFKCVQDSQYAVDWTVANLYRTGVLDCPALFCCRHVYDTNQCVHWTPVDVTWAIGTLKVPNPVATAGS